MVFPKLHLPFLINQTGATEPLFVLTQFFFLGVQQALRLEEFISQTAILGRPIKTQN